MQGSVDDHLLLNFHNHRRLAMPKYHVKLSSGRDFIMTSKAKDEYELAYECYEEACLMDDYLVDVELIPNV